MNATIDFDTREYDAEEARWEEWRRSPEGIAELTAELVGHLSGECVEFCSYCQEESEMLRDPLGIEGVNLYEDYIRRSEQEQETLAAVEPIRGHRAVALDAMCDGPCQSVKPVLYDVTGYTIGWAGHPGAERSSFGICAEDLR